MLDRSDFAKYPFLPGAAEYVKARNITSQEVLTKDFQRILERSKTRILNAIKGSDTGEKFSPTDIEIFSFPRAIMLLSYLQNERVSRRFALFEAKRAYNFLSSETKEKIFHLATETFGWDLQVKQYADEPTLLIHFTDYLRCAAPIKEARWRLINRKLSNGYIALSKVEVARLLQEEIMRRIESKINVHTPTITPEQERKTIDELRTYIRTKLHQNFRESIPTRVISEAVPPCINWLHESLAAGKNLSHMGRFAFTSFMLSIGSSPEEILEYFKTLADFDESKSRYQVEHIDGIRGVKRKYNPPKCSTLKTHGVCHNPDDLCNEISHPIRYYQRRLKILFAEKRKRES
ncbi:hypothetical protein [[Eubacterium] cellulosolvens]